MAKMGGVCLAVTLDTRADITLLPAELESVKEYTRKTALLKGVWDEHRAAPVAKVKLTIGNIEVRGTATMVPRIQLGWKRTIAFTLDDPKQMDLLYKLNQIRNQNHAKEDRRYIPVKVNSDGEITGAMIVADLPKGDVRLERLQKQKSGTRFTTPDVELKLVNESRENTQTTTLTTQRWLKLRLLER